MPIVNAGFALSPQEADWANRVIAALAKGSLGAVTVDGKLVDRPIELMAHAIREEAKGNDK